MHEGPGGGGLGRGNERASLFYLSSADQEIKAVRRRWGARRLAATPNMCVQLPSLHEAKTCSLNDFS